MTKDISTIVKDIYDVIDGGGGWDKTVSDYYMSRVDETMDYRLVREKEEREGTLRASNIGRPCKKALWYHVNSNELGLKREKLPAKVLLKFLYGDMLEDLLLALAKAAGHDVCGEQDEQVVDGLVGHRDCVIDGMVIDVKSASTWAVNNKFKPNALKEPGNDDFGYITQLTLYLAASQDDPRVTNKTQAGFLVIDKTTGELVLDVYDLTDELNDIKDLIEDRREAVKSPTPPPRAYDDEAHQKSGNRILNKKCGFCEWKHSCWPGIQTYFDFRNTPYYFTKIVREPKMRKARDDYK